MLLDCFIYTGYITGFALVVVRPVVSQQFKEAITGFALAWLILAAMTLLKARLS